MSRKDYQRAAVLVVSMAKTPYDMELLTDSFKRFFANQYGFDAWKFDDYVQSAKANAMGKLIKQCGAC
jgi:hypothetical protein